MKSIEDHARKYYNFVLYPIIHLLALVYFLFTFLPDHFVDVFLGKYGLERSHSEELVLTILKLLNLLQRVQVRILLMMTMKPTLLPSPE